MTSELHGIARLAGAPRAAEPAVAAPAGAGGFVTSVQRANDIGPFETVVKRAAAEQTARAGQPVNAVPASATSGAPLTTPPIDPSAKAGKAQKSFESFALQTFIGSMLPKENNKMFGTGNAGKMWQSLLAEKLAEQITASGRLKLLPQQQSGAAAASTPRAVDGATSATSATAATSAPSAGGAQEVTKRQDAAGGMTPAALQAIVGSLKPGRSGGTR
jgi:Rod binding domain-containing protein